jgi:D-serine dehydratase
MMTEQMRPIDHRRFKGLLLPAGVPVTGIGDLGWNALRDLECPVLVLHEEQLVHNITPMADLPSRSGRAGSARQDVPVAAADPALDRSGRLGATAATAAQVRSLLALGVPRILLANLLVDPVAIRWIVTHLLGQGDTGFSARDRGPR